MLHIPVIQYLIVASARGLHLIMTQSFHYSYCRKRPDPNANKGLRLSTEAAGNIGVFNDNSNVPLVDANRTKEEIYRYRWTPRQMVPLPAEPIICHDYRKDSETTGKYTPPPYCGSLRDDHIYESPNW